MKNQKILSIILGSIQVITAIGAIPAGFGFLIDTSGKAMGASPEMLAHSPLKSFLLPGLFLVLVNGLATGIAAVLSFRRHKWAGMSALILGNILCLWIIIQVYWIGLTSFLQPMFFVVGIAEAFLGITILKSKSPYRQIVKSSNRQIL
jgi:hypothetical protein